MNHATEIKSLWKAVKALQGKQKSKPVTNPETKSKDNNDKK